MWVSLLVVIPIFLVVAGGYVFRRLKLVDEKWVSVLNDFVYYVSLPAFIVAGLSKIDFFSSSTWQLIGVNVAVLAIFSSFILILLALLKLSPTLKATIFLGSLVGNTIYMGYPIVAGALPAAPKELVALSGTVYLALGIVIAIAVIEFLLYRGKNLKKHLLDFLKNPLSIAIYVGLFLSFLKGENIVFDSLQSALALVAATASPVALFTLGAFLHNPVRANLAYPGLITVLKNLIFSPLVFLVLAVVFSAKTTNFGEIEPSQILIILAAMPVAVTTFVVADKFKLNKAIIANSILLSTVVALFSLPLILSLIK